MDLERYLELRTLLYAWKTRLAENLRRKVEDSAKYLQRLRTLYEQEGTSEEFTLWLDLWCRQAGIQIILRVLFLRVLEDRGLLGNTRIRTSDGQKVWGMLSRNLGATSYLLWCCRDAAHLLPDLFGPTEYDFLLPDDEQVQRFFDDVWRRPDPNRAGWLRFDFRSDPEKADEGFQTRFIGDLYQELDNEIRERYALLQTPHFISQFILEHTLLKRFEEKDFRTVIMLDPTCGSGHFLVDAFWMFVDQYEKANGSDRAQLSAIERSQMARRIIEEHIFGCDINPYACELARFRLTLAACDYAHPASLRDLFDLRLNIVTIDSLIPYEILMSDGVWGRGATAVLGNPDDVLTALPILKRRYDVVVGNPPYKQSPFPEKRNFYHSQYISASGKFGLSAPFTERFIQLAQESGHIGLINSNGFIQRLFGRQLIENVLPKYDVKNIIDLSGAFIPGHGTPTLILLIINQPPISPIIHMVSCKKGEPEIPNVPEDGLVWRSISDNFYQKGFENEYIQISTRDRSTFSKHPWNLAPLGGPFLRIKTVKSTPLSGLTYYLGPGCLTGADDLYVIPADYARRVSIEDAYLKWALRGEDIRDWMLLPKSVMIVPYRNADGKLVAEAPDGSKVKTYLEPHFKLLKSRKTLPSGRKWYELARSAGAAYLDGKTLAFSFISSHNNFCLNPGTMVYQRSGYSIVLGKNFHEEDYKVLLGLLNTSLTCYYLKQICFKKKPTDDSIRDGYEFASEQVGTIPIPDQAFVQGKNRERFRVLVEETLQCVEELKTIQMSKIFEQSSESYYAWNNIYCSYDSPHTVIKAPFTNMDDLIAIRQKIIDRTQNIHARMIFLQEEMDWLAYEAYGLIPKAPLAEGYLNEIDYKTALLSLGQRPFEIAGKVYKGDWLPGYQPVPLQDFLHTLIESRIAIIQSNPDIATIENPLYKRRWIPSDYDKEFQEAAVWWLGEKLEYALENYGEPITLREWSRLLRDDERINTVLEMLTGSPIFNLETELLKVIRANAVSNRPEHYLKLSGLRKMNGGLFPATELTSGDFNDPVAWKLRGKLNIPRERFIAYREFDHRWRYAGFPESGGPWFGWAGWRPVQRAEALASLLERANRAGWEINYRQCGLRASLRDLLTELKDLPEAERSEFEAISVACGIGLDSHCYCEAYQAACTQGGLCAPGVSAEVLGIKILDGLTYKPHRGRSKGVEKPIQMELDL